MRSRPAAARPASPAALTRRAFVGAAAAASLALVGCAAPGQPALDESAVPDASFEPDAPAADAGLDAPDATAAPQTAWADVLTYTLNEDPQKLDPAFNGDFGSLEINANLYEGLFRFVGTSTDIEPCLATGYDVSDDGLTYTFRLREGVTFHDGTAFDADAVVVNFARQMGGAARENMGYAEFVFGSEGSSTGVASVEALDPHTVRVVLRAPSTPFLRNLAMALGTPIASPTALAANDGDVSAAPCGTGPYRLESWTPGESVVLVRNDAYWDAANAARTERVVFTVTPEAATRVAALSNGETDVVTAVDAATAPALESAGAAVRACDALFAQYVCFNLSSPAVADRAVREAVCQAIDVDELVGVLYGDFAAVARTFMPAFMAPYAQDVAYPAYDPQAARAAFEQAGVTQLTLMCSTTAMQDNPVGGQTLGETIQGYLAQVGVELKLAAYDWTTFRSKLKTDAYDLALSGWSGDNGDPDNFMNLWASTAANNIAHYASTEYDELVGQGIATPLGADRDAVYLRLEELLAEDLPIRPLFHAKSVCAWNPAVDGFAMGPFGYSRLSGVAKRA